MTTTQNLHFTKSDRGPQRRWTEKARYRVTDDTGRLLGYVIGSQDSSKTGTVWSAYTLVRGFISGGNDSRAEAAKALVR